MEEEALEFPNQVVNDTVLKNELVAEIVVLLSSRVSEVVCEKVLEVPVNDEGTLAAVLWR